MLWVKGLRVNTTTIRDADGDKEVENAGVTMSWDKIMSGK